MSTDRMKLCSWTKNRRLHPRPPFGEELVGHCVQVHVAGWLDAVIVEAEVHEEREGSCVRTRIANRVDPEWHLYESEILSMDDPTTPGEPL